MFIQQDEVELGLYWLGSATAQAVLILPLHPLPTHFLTVGPPPQSNHPGLKVAYKMLRSIANIHFCSTEKCVLMENIVYLQGLFQK